MDGEKLKYFIGKNIALQRKQAGLTQAELAEKLNYSDKAVSKWERGESIPDVMTLAQLAEQFGVTVNDLLSDPNAIPADAGIVQQTMGRVVEKTLKRKANRNIILCLSSILVWFIALLLYVVLSSVGIDYSWLAFAYAIAVDGIVMLSLRSAWRDYRGNRTFISIIMWGALLAFYLTMLILVNVNLWRIFLLGVPGQAAILLWFQLFKPHRKHQEEQDG